MAELQVTGRNMEVAEPVRQYLEKRLDKLNRHLPNLTQVLAELAQESTRSPEKRYVVQVTLNNNGTLLRGETRAPDIYKAIDSVTDVLDTQIERFKTRAYRRGKVLPPESEAETTPDAAELEAVSKIVRRKRFPVKPMSDEEAIEQMELLGHDFFIFYNADNSRLNVSYRRKDGNYGLIEPVMD